MRWDLGGTAPGGGDRACPGARDSLPGARRADLRPRALRSGPPVRAGPLPGVCRCRRALHLAPPRGGVRDLRLRRGDARRRVGALGPDGRARRERDRLGHGGHLRFDCHAVGGPEAARFGVVVRGAAPRSRRRVGRGPDRGPVVGRVPRGRRRRGARSDRPSRVRRHDARQGGRRRGPVSLRAGQRGWTGAQVRPTGPCARARHRLCARGPPGARLRSPARRDRERDADPCSAASDLVRDRYAGTTERGCATRSRVAPGRGVGTRPARRRALRWQPAKGHRGPRADHLPGRARGNLADERRRRGVEGPPPRGARLLRREHRRSAAPRDRGARRPRHLRPGPRDAPRQGIPGDGFPSVRQERADLSASEGFGAGSGTTP